VLAPFLAEHGEGRGYLRVLAEPGPGDQRARAARRYVGLLRDHIEREDEVLFPIAEALLSLDDHETLAARYAAVERDVIGAGAHERLLRDLDRLEAVFGVVQPAVAQ
jgi:hemerythrin-like domain-containing protein